jgi:hypothetical protein
MIGTRIGSDGDRATEARGRALPVGTPFLPVARHRAHRPRHHHPPHCVVLAVGHQNAPLYLQRYPIYQERADFGGDFGADFGFS